MRHGVPATGPNGHGARPDEVAIRFFSYAKLNQAKENRLMKKLGALSITSVLVLIICSGVVSSVPAETPDYWPTDGWRTSTPEQQGIDSEQLAEALDFCEEAGVNIHSLLVIRNGHVVADVCFYPFIAGSKHDVASVTKSFTSTLVGIAIDKGCVESVQQPFLDFFPERTVANLDANKRAMTLEHLLTMTSGLECINEPSEVTLFQMMASPDWVQFVLDLPMSDKPGSRFVYNSGGSHLLSAIIRQTAGMSELDFAREHLFEPLGISDVIWPFDPQGVNNHGWGDLVVTPYDMAKLGYLYLHDGLWDGQQVVSREWVAAATTKHVTTHTPDHNGYGYQWWIRSSGGYTAIGRGGQRIFVVPDKNLVVVTTAGGGDRDERILRRLLPSFIIPAVKSDEPLPANPDGVALLESRIREAAVDHTEPKPVPPLPEIARKVSGRRCALDANPYGLASASLVFREGADAATIRLSSSAPTGERSELTLPIGLDDVYRIAPGRLGMPAAAKGFWETDTSFVINLNEIGNINNWRITMTFEDDRVTVQMQENTGLASATFAGTLMR
jgi:CubicO group peptidase (beta-lactamase class C family)